MTLRKIYPHVRSSFLWILILLATNIYPQNVYIPLRVGDRYSLADSSGNLAINAKYDHMQYIGPHYFSYANYIPYTDTIHWYGGRITFEEKFKISSGVYHKTKRVLSNGTHQHYEIKPGVFIIGSEHGYVSENSMIYTLSGKPLFKENLKKFNLFEENGQSIKIKNRYRFVSFFTEHYDKSYSFCVYDLDKEKLDYVLFHVKDFKIERDHYLYSGYLKCSYSDTNYNYHNKIIYFDQKTNRYQISDKKKIDETDGYGTMGGDEIIGPDVDVPSYSGSPDGPSDTLRKKPISPPKPKMVMRRTNFTYKNDSVLYRGDSILLFKPNCKFIYYEKKPATQTFPLIYLKNKKFGLVLSDSSFTETVYDSLTYIKNQYGLFSKSYNILYYAGVLTQEGKWQFGILNQEGQELIPINYDTLLTFLPELRSDNDEKTKTREYFTQEPYKYTNKITEPKEIHMDRLLRAYKNGKYGVLSVENEVIVPFEYDEIFANGLNFFSPLKSDFIILKKAGKYGIIQTDYRGKIRCFVAPVYPYLPTYYYENYNNINNFNVYGLSNSKSLFFCLAKSGGQLFYKEK